MSRDPKGTVDPSSTSGDTAIADLPQSGPGALSSLLRDLARAPSVEPSFDLPLPALAGAAIGRFHLGRELGRGGFGVVYEALDTELHRSVAFKLLRPHRLRADADEVLREAEVVARFSHPNLVTLFDAGRSEYGPYLILELLHGRTLEARLAHGPASPLEAWRIAVDVARGLTHAHARSVVHRDLKPSNVFLCDDGRAKILDFGLALAFGRRAHDGGTPEYMAPEQWRGEPEDERTDVYALGVVLYRALSGDLPFPTDDGGAAARSSRRAPRLRLPSAPALAALVAAMLEKEPARRPRDGGEVLAALLALEQEIVRQGPPSPARGRRAVRAGLASLAVALAAALALVLGYGGWRTRVGERPARRPRAVAVLPFESTGGGAAYDYLGDGLAEDIADLLVRIRELRIVSRFSSFRFKGHAADAAAVAERLRADVLLTGGVRREGDRLRIAVELVDPQTGYRLWSQVYDREPADLFAVQRDIARRVADALEVVLSRASEEALGRTPRAHVAAYDAYLRGREALRRPVTRENLEAAAALFEEAIAKDPGFARAHAGLCEAYLERYEKERAGEHFSRAERACGAALDRDPSAVEVHVALGSLRLAAGKVDDAEREFRRALEGPWPTVEPWIGLARVQRARGNLPGAEAAFAEAERIDATDWRVWQQHGHLLFGAGSYAGAAERYREVLRLTPENASGLNNLGAALYMAGDFGGAVPAFQRSLELAPGTTAWSNLGSALFYAGRFEEAAAAYASASKLSPEDYQPVGNLGDAFTFSEGKAEAAAGAYRRALRLAGAHLRVNPADAEAIAELARYHARLGDAAEARRRRGEALRLAPRSVYVHYNAALVAAQLGETDEAVARLERAVALGYPRGLLPGDVALAALRKDRRFEELVRPREPEAVNEKGGRP